MAYAVNTPAQPAEGWRDARKGVPEVWPEEVLIAMDTAWRKAVDTQRKGHYETLMAVGAAAIRGMFDVEMHTNVVAAAPSGERGGDE